MREREAEGIPMPDPILESLSGLAREQGIDDDVVGPLVPG